MRRLSADELAAVASELGATATGDLSGLVEVQQVDEVVEALAALLVAIVGQRPFDRRNHAVAVVALGLLAQLNGRRLDLTPSEDVAALIARVRDGLAADGEVRDWLAGRLADAMRAPASGLGCSTCPACSMPLREALAVVAAGRIALPVCGGCGHLLSRPVPHRSPQEV